MGRAVANSPRADNPFVDIDAEQAFLGACLIDSGNGFQQAEGIIQPEYFSMPQHQVIYDAMLKLRTEGRPTDIVLVTGVLGTERINEAGGLPYVCSLSLICASSLNVVHYAERVAAAGRRRIIHETGLSIAGNATTDPETVLDTAETLIAGVRQNHSSVRPVHDKVSLVSRMQAWLDRPPGEDDEVIKTGIAHLDAFVRGMKRTDFIVIGAYPGHGKTSLSTTIAHHVGMKRNQPVAFFTLEMSEEMVAWKIVCIETGIPWKRVESRSLSEDERRRVTEAHERLTQSHLEIIPTREQSIEWIRETARQMHRKERLALVVVDYLQLVSVKNAPAKENRAQLMSSVAMSLKNMALELDTVVLVPSQLKNPESNSERAPVMTDVKESGDIAAAATAMWMLSWPKGGRVPAPRPEVEEIVLDVAKHRMGDVGKMMLGFRGSVMEFVSLDHPTAPPPAETPRKRGREAAYSDEEGITL